MKYRFVDLVDIERFRVMMHSFYEATGLSLALIDTDNNILCGEGWQAICTEFHRCNSESVRRCHESDHFIAAHLREAPFIGYRCLNGLMDYATPVVIEGQHVATMFTGQFLHEPADLDFFRQQAAQFGFDEAAYLAALARVPVIPKEKAEATMRFYAELAQMLGVAGLERVRQKEADQLIAAANRELEELSYSVSHDLRTPLRAIDGFAKILVEDYSARLDDEGRRMLKVVRDNAQRMGLLIDDILRFLRLGKRKMALQDFDMAQLVQETFAQVQASVPWRRLRLDARALPPAWGDREMVRQALENLLSNAVKFSSADGETVVEVGGTADGGDNAYYVRDWGVGFDMRYVDKLFKVFERVHATGQYEGTGIGLAIVKRIADRHGGRVWAEGRVGQGATFHFALPQRRS